MFRIISCFPAVRITDAAFANIASVIVHGLLDHGPPEWETYRHGGEWV